MSESTPPGRKRPHCHTCRAPMSGHKRINSKPVCPNDNPTSPGASPIPRQLPRLVPQVVIPPYVHPQSTRAKRERPASPTPTVRNEEVRKGEETDDQESLSQPSTSTIPLRQTGSFSAFTRSFGLDKPLASLFVSPKSRVDAVQRRAGELGMFSGAVYKPRGIKEEESEQWVVMGPDPNAVDRLLDCQQKEVEQLLLKRRMPGDEEDEEVGVKRVYGVGFFQLIIAGAIGGFVVFNCLTRL